VSSVLVFVATDGGRIRRASLEVLSEVREQARNQGLTVDALIVSEAPEVHIDGVSEYGPDRILTVGHDVFAQHRNQPLIAAIVAAIGHASPRAVLMASTEGAKDILGALAIRTDSGAIPDVASFELGSDVIRALRPVMAAKELARTESSAAAAGNSCPRRRPTPGARYANFTERTRQEA